MLVLLEGLCPLALAAQKRVNISYVVLVILRSTIGMATSCLIFQNERMQLAIEGGQAIPWLPYHLLPHLKPCGRQTFFRLLNIG